MRKIFKKVLAGITSAALVATLLVGINATSTVKAADEVTLANWTFVQGGQFNDNELWNTAYINSVVMDGTNESVSGWVKGNDALPSEQDPSFNQTLSATQLSNGFTMDIGGNSQDKDWANDRINPWSIRAEMMNVAIIPGHIYTVSFNARASKIKYAYVGFGSDIAGTAPYGEAPVEGNNPLIKLTTAEQPFTYTFTNWASCNALNITLNLGSFNSQNDYAGNDVSDIITAPEAFWEGQVYISDFTIADLGVNPEYKADPPKQTTAAPETTTVAPTTQTQKPTVAPTPAAPTVKKLAKVKKLKVKNNKKGTIKITWKKVANAQKYQIKVGKKTYTSKKVKKVVKKLKKGKKYTVKVRAVATGYKTAKWAKKKIKIKK